MVIWVPDLEGDADAQSLILLEESGGLCLSTRKEHLHLVGEGTLIAFHWGIRLHHPLGGKESFGSGGGGPSTTGKYGMHSFSLLH
jgi:hypothetical protein